MAKSTVVASVPGAAVMANYPPTMIFDVDEPSVEMQTGLPGGGGVLALKDGADIGASRVSATATNTLTGTPVEADVLTFVINGVSIVYTAPAGPPSLTQVAAAIVLLINANADLYNIVHATSAVGVITLTHMGGLAGNYVPLVVSEVVGNDLDQTLSGSTMSGGTGAIVALRNFTFNYRPFGTQGQTFVRHFLEGHEYTLGAAWARSLVRAGAPVA